MGLGWNSEVSHPGREGLEGDSDGLTKAIAAIFQRDNL